MIDNVTAGVNRLRVRKPLNTSRNIDRLSKIVQPLVERHGQTRTFVNADFEQQVFRFMRLAEPAHRVPHSQRCRHRTIRRRERRHDRIPNGFDDRAGLGGGNVIEHAEMRPHSLRGNQIADALVERGRPFQVSE